MKRTIVITDLTRFQNPDIVCTAGIDNRTGDCIRPLPYLRTLRCERLQVAPGAILTGHFTPSPKRDSPHREDCEYRNLRFQGTCSSAEFKRVLLRGLFNSVAAGFQAAFSDDQKHLPPGHRGRRSLITVRADPAGVEVIDDSFRPGKIKLNFTDESGQRFRYISITDLGFHDYARQHHAPNELQELNRWIRAQDEVLLRLGLSRNYKAADGRAGYWLQANGIYTFPEHHKAARTYWTTLRFRIGSAAGGEKPP